MRGSRMLWSTNTIVAALQAALASDRPCAPGRSDRRQRFAGAVVLSLVSGAGAAAIATAEHYVRLGVKRENILMCDRSGVIYEGRTEGDMDPYKARFANPYTAAERGSVTTQDIWKDHPEKVCAFTEEFATKNPKKPMT